MTAIIYARYSSYNQTERSIEGQIEDCEKYAKANEIQIIGQYVDRARSGTSAEARPDFQRMIKDAEKKQFDTILIYKLDRFARNRYDSAIYKARLKKYGVRVISVTENISDEPEGIILESMLEGMAEYYSANLSQNVRRGLRVARENGTFTGGYLPYGYGLDGKKIIVNEHEADAVRYLFAEYARGTRLKDIVAEINRQGYRPRVGAVFSPNSFQFVLRNRKYLGEYRFKDEDIPSPYPRIIDDATFQAVQARIDAVRHAPAAAKSKVDYLLQGKIYCGHCGANMVGESGRGKGGNVYHYYACRVRKKLHGCQKSNEKKDAVEDYVVKETLEYVLQPDRIEQIAALLIDAYKKEFSTGNCGKLQRMIEEIDREIDDCVDTLITNRKNAAISQRINARVDELSDKKAAIELDLAKLRAAKQNVPKLEEVKAWLESFGGGDPLDAEFRRRLIDTFVSAVYVFDDKIVIYYNVQGQGHITYEEMLADVATIPPSDAQCSDMAPTAPPKSAKPEHHIIIHFGLFGFAATKKASP